MTDDADSEEAVDPEQEADVDAGEGEGQSASAEADGSDVADDEDGRDPELSNGADDTVPNVELGLYQLSVRVSGRSGDDLQTVEDSAKRLMDYLIDRAGELEERPDDRGLG
ncbi:hypothetical protein C474_02421 [Halogeometricum pallidum JCM 14848]|uniref:Uncharacterized protein n=1 Tax=Halogeometricum pallidum JCM 14848 TaxID=1227487 RepID=M0DIB7_HALPD|nr:hypothetical protein [Halogeometricum pallidum]ELZ34523.1 hypothetical protein C474_02421 [Halogeometricum pallidum JCM 14848]